MFNTLYIYLCFREKFSRVETKHMAWVALGVGRAHVDFFSCWRCRHASPRSPSSPIVQAWEAGTGAQPPSHGKWQRTPGLAAAWPWTTSSLRPWLRSAGLGSRSGCYCLTACTFRAAGVRLLLGCFCCSSSSQEQLNAASRTG